MKNESLSAWNTYQVGKLLNGILSFTLKHGRRMTPGEFAKLQSRILANPTPPKKSNARK